MKKSDELKQERYSLMTELRGLKDSGLENRKMEKRETELTDKVHELSGEILKAEREEKESIERAMRSGTVIRAGNNDLENYSFSRALRIAAGFEKPDGLEEEMNQEARREMSHFGTGLKGFGVPSVVLNRASTGQNVGTDSEGGYLVGPGGMKFFAALRNRLTLTKLGATFLTGLQGTLPMLEGGTFSASWVSEGSEISKSKTSFTDRGTLSPKRLGSLGAISRELIHSSSIAVEQIIINELVDSIAQAIEAAAINGSGTGATPSGILNYSGIGSVVGGTNGAAPDYDDIVNLEREVSVNNADIGSMGFLTNPKVRAKLKQTAIGTDQKMVWGEKSNVLNGYNAYVTNGVPSDLDKGDSTGVCSAIIFGAWDKLIIGMWGGLDLIVDPYTQKARGEVEITVNQFMDLGLSNPAHFAAMKDALTS